MRWHRVRRQEVLPMKKIWLVIDSIDSGVVLMISSKHTRLTTFTTTHNEKTIRFTLMNIEMRACITTFLYGKRQQFRYGIVMNYRMRWVYLIVTLYITRFEIEILSTFYSDTQNYLFFLVLVSYLPTLYSWDVFHSTGNPSVCIFVMQISDLMRSIG